MSKIKRVDYSYFNWGPYVMKTKLPDYFIEKLKIEGEKSNESYNHYLAGHLDHQFAYPKDFQQWFYNEIQPVISAYRDGHCKYHGIENLMVEIRATDLWINFMKAGDFNPSHIHGGDYTFVIFVDVPKELKKEQEEYEGTSAKPGSLMFEFTQQARPRWATTGTAIKPETGDMYMFPAMLQHWVAPFKSKVTRITVSGNLSIVNRNNLPSDYF